MKRVRFGRSGLRVTEYCLGCLTMGRLQAGLGARDGARIITTAVEHGVNFIDTAETYGNDEQVKIAVENLEQENPASLADLVIATKTKARSAQDMETFVSRTLEIFHRDRLDVVSLHNVADGDDFKHREDAFNRVLEFHDDGIIADIGLTAHSMAGFSPVLDHAGEFSVIMPIINFKGIGLRGYSLDELQAFLTRVKQKNISVYSMKSLGGGHLRNEAVEAINWLRHNPRVDVACVGAKDPVEVLANIHAFEDTPVPTGIKESIDRVERRVRIYTHLCEKCGKCAEACTSGALKFSEKSGPMIDHETCVICGYCAGACPKFIIRVV
ncbi:hypothetical protein GF325_16305 [Candidatus Bathyarchaeota archaeon]|nr:hypothetical protein [Candidatus Bathyarchaeota archaeon]